jgi:hypothetical protein
LKFKKLKKGFTNYFGSKVDVAGNGRENYNSISMKTSIESWN